MDILVTLRSHSLFTLYPLNPVIVPMSAFYSAPALNCMCSTIMVRFLTRWELVKPKKYWSQSDLLDNVMRLKIKDIISPNSIVVRGGAQWRF